MRDITLRELLEAGCHFGHRVERWHPKAAKFIYQPREGIHIIDLAKTRTQLLKAGEFVHELGKTGKTFLFVATKRQAKGVVAEAAKKSGAMYLTNRWIGGFMTNWEEVRKNIDKMIKMRKEKKEEAWSKFPKHEQIKLEKDLRNLETVYSGVAEATAVPDAIYIVDIKKEAATLKEAIRREVTSLAIVDTNVNPDAVDFPVPANDDAVGSIQCITDFLADAYLDGKAESEERKAESERKEEKNPPSPDLVGIRRGKEEKPKKRGRPKNKNTKSQAPNHK